MNAFTQIELHELCYEMNGFKKNEMMLYETKTPTSRWQQVTVLMGESFSHSFN